MTLKPRGGIDVAYAQTIGSEVSGTGTLDIDPANYARGYLEVGFVRETATGMLEITPRVFCEAVEVSGADACGFGGTIDFSSIATAAGTQWDFGFDYDYIDERQSASLAVAHSQVILNGLGVSKSSFGATATGAVELAQNVEFTW